MLQVSSHRSQVKAQKNKRESNDINKERVGKSSNKFQVTSHQFTAWKGRGYTN